MNLRVVHLKQAPESLPVVPGHPAKVACASAPKRRRLAAAVGLRPLSRRSSRAHGFTLLEMLVAVSILVVIIFALYQMFNQTQRAFRGGVRQVDVMEAGRAAMEIIANEVQQMAASGLPDAVNFYNRTNAFGFVTPFYQNLPDGTTRTHVIEEFFFLSHPNGRSWQLSGFFVDANNPPALSRAWGPGTLYRFRTNGVPLSTNVMLPVFTQASALNSNSCYRICEGVIHFQVRPLDAAGRQLFMATAPANPAPYNVSVLTTGQEVPHFVEVELGLLDADLLRQAYPLPTQTAYINFLNNRPGGVRLFRQVIPIAAAPR